MNWVPQTCKKAEVASLHSPTSCASYQREKQTGVKRWDWVGKGGTPHIFSREVKNWLPLLQPGFCICAKKSEQVAILGLNMCE